MRKIKFVKVVDPEIVAYFLSRTDTDNTEYEYRCPECGFGVAEDYVVCPHCGSELNWKQVKSPSQKFIKFLDRL